MGLANKLGPDSTALTLNGVLLMQVITVLRKIVIVLYAAKQLLMEDFRYQKKSRTMSYV